MRWLKRGKWKVSIVIAGLLLLLIFMVWVPVSAAGTYERASGFARQGTVTLQTPSAADLTVTAVVQDQLMQQDEKARRDNSFPWTLLNAIGGSILIAAAAIISTIIGFSQWRGNRNDERRKETAAHDKELRAQAEERFKTAVTALGDKNEGTQVGGAILLRSFLNKDDEEIYGRYYMQIFDLAVAYLRLSNTSQPPDDPDGLPPPPVDPNAPLLLTPLRQPLIAVFQEVFPLARKRLGPIKSALVTRSLDASHIRLDGSFLVGSDLKYIWLIDASIDKARLSTANFYRADLRRTTLRSTILTRVNLREANLTQANLSKADLSDAYLTRANLRGVKFNGAILTGTDLSDANFGSETYVGEKINPANPEDALSLKDANFYGVKGLTREQLIACRAKGAYIDEDTITGSSQSAVSSAQVNTPPPSTDGSSSTSSQPNAES